MTYEERTIHLKPTEISDESAPGGKRIILQGIHARDCCFPPKEVNVTNYWPVIDPNDGTIKAQGWADYGNDVIYREPMSLPEATVSQAHPVYVPPPSEEVHFEALTQCSICSPCFNTLPETGLELHPRRDFPDGYEVTDSISVSVDNGTRCDYLVAPSIANMDATGCDCNSTDFPSTDDNQCEDCFYNPGEPWLTDCFGETPGDWTLIAQWFGGLCQHWTGELGDPCTGYSLVNVYVMNYCKYETNEDGSCVYRVKTVISVCIRDRVVPAFACNSLCQSSDPGCAGTIAGWGCFEQPAYKLCNPKGTYSIAIKNPEDNSAKCSSTVVIS